MNQTQQKGKQWLELNNRPLKLTEDKQKKIALRLEYLRDQIRNESISYYELFELQSLAAYIEENDVELLEWAGVTEHKLIGNCPKCGANLYKTKSIGYYGQCLECDEDFYKIEVIK